MQTASLLVVLVVGDGWWTRRWLVGGTLSLLTTDMEIGALRLARRGHITKHAEYLRFQFSLMTCEKNQIHFLTLYFELRLTEAGYVRFLKLFHI